MGLATKQQGLINNLLLGGVTKLEVETQLKWAASTIVAHQREARARWNVESHALDRVLFQPCRGGAVPRKFLTP